MLQKIQDLVKQFDALYERIGKLIERASSGRVNNVHYKRMDRLQGKVQTILSNLLEIGNDPDASDDAVDAAADAYDNITEKIETQRTVLREARRTRLKNLFPRAGGY